MASRRLPQHKPCTCENRILVSEIKVACSADHHVLCIDFLTARFFPNQVDTRTGALEMHTAGAFPGARAYQDIHARIDYGAHIVRMNHIIKNLVDPARQIVRSRYWRNHFECVIQVVNASLTFFFCIKQVSRMRCDFRPSCSSVVAQCRKFSQTWPIRDT